MQLQKLFLDIFNKSYDDPGNGSMLRELVKKYPYFTAPQFFLLKKTEPGTGYYNQIAARTALHFDNPFLLNFRLKEVDKVIETGESNRINEVEMISIKEPIEKIFVAEEAVSVENIDPVKASEVQPVDKVIEAEQIKTEEPMIFEPLFASDYFASQGIKLSEEVQSGDKLGKQLKSFTEWLKSMKKVHEGRLPAGNEQIDLAVQNLAEKSNLEDDVLTESMADAYLQQGKTQKARQIFEKLSLLDPAKSAYFAAKIEQAD